jgi:hypothetical protein
MGKRRLSIAASFSALICISLLFQGGCSGGLDVSAPSDMAASILVNVRVEQAPIANETLPIVIEMRSGYELEDLEVELDLPKGMDLMSGDLAWTSPVMMGELKRAVALRSRSSGLQRIDLVATARLAGGGEMSTIQSIFLMFQERGRQSKLEVPILLSAAVAPTPSLGQVVHLDVWATALIDSPATKLRIDLPEGLVLAGGERSASIDLAQNEEFRISADISVEMVGELPVAISATSTSPQGATWGRTMTLYFQIDDARLGDTVTEFPLSAIEWMSISTNEPAPTHPPPEGASGGAKRKGAIIGPPLDAERLSGGRASDPISASEVSRTGIRIVGLGPELTEMESSGGESISQQEGKLAYTGRPDLPIDDPAKAANPSLPNGLVASSGWTVIMTEDFEGVFPSGLWDVFDNDGAANGEFFWDDDDYKSQSGSWGAWPAKGGADGIDPELYYYPNNMDSWMVYGPFDLSDATDAELQFHYWNISELNHDWFSWCASADGTYFYCDSVSGDSFGWNYVNFDLTSVPGLGNLTGDSTVWIGLIFESDSSNFDEGPFVDDFLLQKHVGDVGDLTVYGWWEYRDKAGEDHPIPYARVQIWDSDIQGDDLLATTWADRSGYYSATFPNSDESGGVDLYVRVYSTDDYSANVRTGGLLNELYFSETPTTDDVPDGSFEVGAYVITDSDNRMAWYIYDQIAEEAWVYLSSEVGWDNDYNLQVRWNPTSTDGTYYNGAYIALVAGDRWDEDVILHEFGHFVMDMIYAIYPATPNCDPHYWGQHSSLGCAWSEGWATFLQGAIQNSPAYVDTEDQTISFSMEPPDPTADHPEDEGAVSASLWDVFDDSGSSEGFDALANGIDGISSNGLWSIVYATNPNDINEFRDHWYISSNGFNPDVASIFVHHLIDANLENSLSVVKQGTGNGTVTSVPEGINCGSTCTASFAYNTEVILAAVAEAGSSFAGWSGEGCSGTSTCPVTMDTAKSVTATFTLAAPTWYLAEGYTGGGFGTYILIQNPNEAEANVTVTYMLQGGGTIERQHVVAGNSRYTIVAQDETQVGLDAAFSAKLEADQPIIVERAMYWPNGDGSIAGHGAMGIRQPAGTWYLAEGYTGAGFGTYILIQNPNEAEANVMVTYMLQGGGVVEREVVVEGYARYTIVAQDAMQVGLDVAFSTKLEADQPIIVERAMYFNNEGHDATGVVEPAHTWYLAEGYTGAGFGTYILIQNPNETEANVTVTYMLQEGGTIERGHVVAANSRYTIVAQEEGQVGLDAAFSTKLEADQPIIVERAMYWPNGSESVAGHGATGVMAPSSTWYLAEGYTGAGFGTYILIQNPNEAEANVTVTYMLQGGGVVTRELVVGGNSRYTIMAQDGGQVGVDAAFSTKLEADQPIIVERAMYFNNGGHCTAGVQQE